MVAHHVLMDVIVVQILVLEAVELAAKALVVEDVTLLVQDPVLMDAQAVAVDVLLDVQAVVVDALLDVQAVAVDVLLDVQAVAVDVLVLVQVGVKILAKIHAPMLVLLVLELVKNNVIMDVHQLHLLKPMLD